MTDMPGGMGGGGGAAPKSNNPWAIAARQAGKALAAGGRSLTESAGKYAENVHPVEYRKGGKIRKSKARVEGRVISKRKDRKDSAR